MRGDKRRLEYKGRRQSHRFTILGDTSFEYDCILEKPPETNVISLLIEGAEYYNFYRQPDFVKNPLLRGSYAVYKKEILIGEGTGKLCHIHRPQIIDARGRRCWGSLAVVGNVLRITIPDKWLGEVAYPVIVDPIVGTSTIGEHFGYYEDYEEDYYDEDENEWYEFDNYYYPFIVDSGFATNRYIVPEDMYGRVTASVYLCQHNTKKYSGYEYNYNKTIRPCLYSDKNNAPLRRLSTNELLFDDVVNGTTKPKGWRTATFDTKQPVSAGTPVWFGVYCLEFQPRFDFGAKCYICYDDDYGLHDNPAPPDNYPVENYWGELDYISIDVIISMYFNYVAMQNYVRTIYQGVKLTDNRKLKADYKRNLTQTVKAGFVLKSLGTFYRKCISSAYTSLRISRFPAFVRTVADFIKATMAHFENRSLSRKCADDVKAQSDQHKIHNAVRKASDVFNATDRQSFFVLFVRSVPDTVLPSGKMRHLGSFIRGLLLTAGNTAETTRKADYYRFQKDNVQAQGLVFRGLLLFVRIISKVFFRDYLLGRFIRAREDLILKSAVCREIILESKVN
jgi:hypothetical protein